MHVKDILCAACLAAALLGAGGAAHAGTATTGAYAAAKVGPLVNDQDQSFSGTASSSIRADWNEGAAFGHGSALAIAGDGFVKAYGEGSAYGWSSEGWTATGGGSGSARFVENLTFSSAAHAGMPGQVTVAALFDAALHSFGLATASTSFSLRVGNTNGIVFAQIQSEGIPVFSQIQVNDAMGPRVLPYANVGSLTFNFTWGDTLQIVMDLLAAGNTKNALTVVSGAEADAAHSGYWGGILSATAGGVAITDYSVLSATGVDYRNSFAVAAPVPEPESVALLAAGLLMVWGRVRRAARRNRTA